MLSIESLSPQHVLLLSHMTGLQGMGFPEIAVTGAMPPFHKMLEDKAVKDPIFSFWLSRGEEGDEGGEMVLGGADPDHFKGEHVW